MLPTSKLAPQTSANLPNDYKELDKFVRGVKCVCVLHIDDYNILALREDSSVRPLRGITPSFTIREAGESGVGMYARSIIATGDLIWEEKPLVLVPDELITDVWTSISERLDATAKETIVGLRNAHPPDVEMIEGCLRTNFVGIELSGANISYRALFPIISRANHSCCSNATYFFNNNSLALELRAARQILPEEEVCIQYIDVLLPKVQRQTLLKQLYFFWCQCPSCIFSDGSVHHLQSDLNRARLKDWYGEHVTLQQWLDDFSVPAPAVKYDTLELIRLINVESLQVMQRFALDLMCACLAALGEEEDFRVWAERAKVASQMGGDDHPMVSYYVKALLDPTSIHIWNMRKLQQSPNSESEAIHPKAEEPSSTSLRPFSAL